MQVGTTVVYVEQTGSAMVEDDSIRAVAAKSPGDVFSHAGDVLEQCVLSVGKLIDGLDEKTRPTDITVEFTLTFEALGKATLIPVILTGESKAAAGLKVTAVWRQPNGEG